MYEWWSSFSIMVLQWSIFCDSIYYFVACMCCPCLNLSGVAHSLSSCVYVFSFSQLSGVAHYKNCEVLLFSVSLFDKIFYTAMKPAFKLINCLNVFWKRQNFKSTAIQDNENTLKFFIIIVMSKVFPPHLLRKGQIHEKVMIMAYFYSNVWLEVYL